MLPSVSNRYSVLSEEASNSQDLRIEMQDFQTTATETEEAKIREVSGLWTGNSVTCLTMPPFDLQLDEREVAEEAQVSSKAMEIGEVPPTEDAPRASSTKGPEL